MAAELAPEAAGTGAGGSDELRLGVEPEVPTLVLQTLPDGTEEQAAAVTKGQRLAFALEARREEARVAKRARAGSAAGDDGGSAVDGARRRARRAGARQVLSAAAAAAAREKLTSGVKTVEEAHRSLMRASEELTFMSNLLGLVTGQQYFKVEHVARPVSLARSLETAATLMGKKREQFTAAHSVLERARDTHAQAVARDAPFFRHMAQLSSRWQVVPPPAAAVRAFHQAQHLRRLKRPGSLIDCRDMKAGTVGLPSLDDLPEVKRRECFAELTRDSAGGLVVLVPPDQPPRSLRVEIEGGEALGGDVARFDMKLEDLEPFSGVDSAVTDAHEACLRVRHTLFVTEALNSLRAEANAVVSARAKVAGASLSEAYDDAAVFSEDSLVIKTTYGSTSETAESKVGDQRFDVELPATVSPDSAVRISVDGRVAVTFSTVPLDASTDGSGSGTVGGGHLAAWAAEVVDVVATDVRERRERLRRAHLRGMGSERSAVSDADVAPHQSLRRIAVLLRHKLVVSAATNAIQAATAFGATVASEPTKEDGSVKWSRSGNRVVAVARASLACAPDEQLRVCVRGSRVSVAFPSGFHEASGAAGCEGISEAAHAVVARATAHLLADAARERKRRAVIKEGGAPQGSCRFTVSVDGEEVAPIVVSIAAEQHRLLVTSTGGTLTRTWRASSAQPLRKWFVSQLD